MTAVMEARRRRPAAIRIIAINREAEHAPAADVWYAHDARFWAAYDRPFAGMKIGIEPYPGVLRLLPGGETGLETDPGRLALGGASGYQAINLARHFGASRILLLGYDCTAPKKGPKHWFGNHPAGLSNPGAGAFARWMRAFPTIAAALAAERIEVLNASRESAIECFPRVDLSAVLMAP